MNERLEDVLLMSSQELSSHLYKLITAHFTLNDLETLCLELDVNYEDLNGTVISIKAQSLILHMKHRDNLSILIDALIQNRPHLRKTIESIELGQKTIPFVIAAMTKQEANELQQGRILNEPITIDGFTLSTPVETLNRFETYQKELNNHGIKSIIGCYGDLREDWAPHYGQKIYDVIQAISKPSNFIPQFHSNKIFSHH